MKTELSKHDLKGLSKYDFTNIKAELQNKYHAELEVLREDYENRIDLLNVEHENKLRDIERKYGEEIETLKYDLAEALKVAQNGSIQEVVSGWRKKNVNFSCCLKQNQKQNNICVFFCCKINKTKLVVSNF